MTKSDTAEYSVVVADAAVSYRRRPVIMGASWRVRPGVTALLGPNGAGKTTLMRAMLGLHPLSGGDISVLGSSVRSARGAAEIRARTGYAPQAATLPGLSRVRDVIAYAGWLHGLSRASASGAAEHAMREVGVTELAGRRLRTLSGGQRQRVVLACAIAHEPDVLLLDEPTAGLDPASRMAMRSLLVDLSRGRTIIISTHLVEDVEHLADDVAVLSDGRIQFAGTVAELARRASGEGGRRTGRGSDFERGYVDLLADDGSIR